MGDRFDKLAKDAAGDMSRREAFGRIGWGIVVSFLASVGLARADNDKNICAQKCVECCQTLDLLPRSEEYGQCIRECHENRNFCGTAVRAGGCTE